MRKCLVAISAIAALVIGVLSPVPSFAGPTASPGKSVGNGPCLTSGNANSQIQSTKNTNKACVAALYKIGDTGPGGGKIFYVDSVGFNCGSDFSATGSPTFSKCHYLEVAPNDWYRSLPPQGCYNNSEDPRMPWAIDEYLNISIPGAREVAIGGGFKNSTQIVYTIDRNYECFAAGLARTYQNTTNLQWYLPSIEELQALQQNQIAVGLTSFSFWSSTENDASTAKDLGNFNAPGNGSKATTTKIRPIRAF